MPSLTRDQLLDLLGQAAEICAQKDRTDLEIYGTSPQWAVIQVIPAWVRAKVPGMKNVTWGEVHEILNGGSSRGPTEDK